MPLTPQEIEKIRAALESAKSEAPALSARCLLMIIDALSLLTQQAEAEPGKDGGSINEAYLTGQKAMREKAALEIPNFGYKDIIRSLPLVNFDGGKG